MPRWLTVPHVTLPELSHRSWRIAIPAVLAALALLVGGAWLGGAVGNSPDAAPAHKVIAHYVTIHDNGTVRTVTLTKKVTKFKLKSGKTVVVTLKTGGRAKVVHDGTTETETAPGRTITDTSTRTDTKTDTRTDTQTQTQTSTRTETNTQTDTTTVTKTETTQLPGTTDTVVVTTVVTGPTSTVIETQTETDTVTVTATAPPPSKAS
jgi:hypothetical protein